MTHDEVDQGGGGLDLGALLQQAQKMQADLLAAQAQAQAEVVEGSAGGGAVRIQVSGGGEFRAVHLDPAAITPDEPDLLEDLILAALHDAMAKVQALGQRAMGQVGVPGLGGLGELFR